VRRPDHAVFLQRYGTEPTGLKHEIENRDEAGGLGLLTGKAPCARSKQNAQRGLRPHVRGRAYENLPNRMLRSLSAPLYRRRRNDLKARRTNDDAFLLHHRSWDLRRSLIGMIFGGAHTLGRRRPRHCTGLMHFDMSEPRDQIDPRAKTTERPPFSKTRRWLAARVQKWQAPDRLEEFVFSRNRPDVLHGIRLGGARAPATDMKPSIGLTRRMTER
jgi:hypothetical protein